MNFKSNAAYKAWLAYGHASGEFAKTPGHQPVSIKGKSKTVEHALGGELGEPEVSPLNAYEVSYGDLPPELERYMSMPGVNPTKVMEWFNLGLAEPQTYNQAKLLAEAVGYNPEQAKVVAAQWQMESGGGSRLSSPYNYFGIKSHNEDVRQRLLEKGIQASAGESAKTSEYKDGKKISQKSSFMEFNNAFEGFAAHKAFLETNPRYAKALSTENAKDFAVGLEKAGYATAPNYGTTLYQNYVAPKEKNPKAGDSRPKSLGETKSEKIKPFTQDTAPRAEVGKLPLLPPQRLEVETPINLEPTITSGMYGSVPYEAKVEPTKAIPMDAPAGFFGSGKTMFNYGGLMNNYRQGGFNNPGFNALPPEVQNKIKARTFAAGGPMAGPLTEFNTGGTHEENPLGGIPQGVAPDGKVNRVEQDETKLDSANYIFSNRLKVTKAIAKAFNLPTGLIDKTFAEASKKLNLSESRRENDTIENKYKEKMLDELVKAQELHKQEEMAKDFAIMAEKYPEQMAAMMQAQQPQMAPSVPGEVMAAGMNPAQEAPSPEAIPSSQLPMSYGGSLYGCGGKMYAPGGWLEENQGAVSGAAQGFLSGAATGAAMGAATGPLAFLGAPAGALIGGTISAFAQGRKGAQEDEARADAKLAEQNAQYAQSAANPNVGVATAGMPVTPMPGTAPMYPNYQANVARNGGTLPSYHQYPQSLVAQFANNAGPMGQPLTNLYAPGGFLGDPPNKFYPSMTKRYISNPVANDPVWTDEFGTGHPSYRMGSSGYMGPFFGDKDSPYTVEFGEKYVNIPTEDLSVGHMKNKIYRANSQGLLQSKNFESYPATTVGGDKTTSFPNRYVSVDTTGYSAGAPSFPVTVVESNISDGAGGSTKTNKFDATREQIPAIIKSMKNQTAAADHYTPVSATEKKAYNIYKNELNKIRVAENAAKVEANRKKVEKNAKKYAPGGFLGGPGTPGGPTTPTPPTTPSTPTHSAPLISYWTPTLPPTYAADYKKQLQDWANMPKDKSGIPIQGQGGSDAGSIGTGGSWGLGTPAQVAERIKYLESFTDPADLRPDMLEEYIQLKNNKAYTNTKGFSGAILTAPFDLRTYTPPSAASLASMYPPPKPETPGTHLYLDANTGQAVMDLNPKTGQMEPRVMPEGSWAPRQYSQYVEQAANSPEAIAERKAIDAERLKNQNLLDFMTEEQKQEMRSLKITPQKYLEKEGLPFNQAVGGKFAMGGHMYDGITNSTGFLSLPPSGMSYTPQAETLMNNPFSQGQSYLNLPTTPITTGSGNSSATTTTTGNYNVDPSLTDTTQDLSVTGTPLQTLSQLAPIAYNTYQALKKPQSYKPSDFYSLQEAIRPDYSQAYNEAKNTYAQMMKNAGQGLSGGARAAYMANTAFERNRAMGQVAMAEENAYREDMARVRAANAASIEAGKKAALQTNWATQAARQEHLKEALTQGKDWQDTELRNKLATNYAIMGAPDISKFKNIGYTPYLESLFKQG